MNSSGSSQEPDTFSPAPGCSVNLQVGVFAGVMLAGFLGVVNCVDVVAMRDVCVMTCRMVIPGVVVFGCCSMVASGLFVVLRGLAMVLGGFSGHGKTSDEV